MNEQTENSLQGPKKNRFVALRKMKGYLKAIYIIPLLGFLLLIAGSFFYVLQTNTVPSQTIINDDQRVEIKKAKASQKLNKDFSFPLKDDKGKELSQIKYMIENAELRDEIVVKGEKATAIKGRTFLVLNLKITNSFDRAIQINSRDYVRLSVNKSNERLAPDIHNDQVEIQAISTKYTRIGFPINDTDKDLILQVGEITGEKQTVPLTLNN